MIQIGPKPLIKGYWIKMVNELNNIFKWQNVNYT